MAKNTQPGMTDIRYAALTMAGPHASKAKVDQWEATLETVPWMLSFFEAQAGGVCEDEGAPDPNCDCVVCESRAILRAAKGESA